MAKPQISVVLGTYNRKRFLKEALRAIFQELEGFSVSHEVIVVDGGSTDGTIAWLVRQKNVLSIVQHNRGLWNGRPIQRRSWGSFMNLAFRAAQGKYVCMLSDDCLVIPGAIANGYRCFEDQLSRGKRIGALAFYWRNWPEDDQYFVGTTLGGKLFVNHGIYLKEALEKVGYIDEERYQFYHADGDLCLRIWQQDMVCLPAPDSYIEHISHANMAVRRSNAELQRRDWAAFIERWRGIYYDAESHNVGGWLKKEHTDPTNTAKRFHRALPPAWYLRRWLRPLKHFTKRDILGRVF
jgi:glycosyltransferase involved in cell wall biosynthesis